MTNVYLLYMECTYIFLSKLFFDFKQISSRISVTTLNFFQIFLFFSKKNRFFSNPAFCAGCVHEPAQGAREAVDPARARPASGRIQAQGEDQRQAEGILCKPGEILRLRCFSKEIMQWYILCQTLRS